MLPLKHCFVPDKNSTIRSQQAQQKRPPNNFYLSNYSSSHASPIRKIEFVSFMSSPWSISYKISPSHVEKSRDVLLSNYPQYTSDKSVREKNALLYDPPETFFIPLQECSHQVTEGTTVTPQQVWTVPLHILTSESLGNEKKIFLYRIPLKQKRNGALPIRGATEPAQQLLLSNCIPETDDEAVIIAKLFLYEIKVKHCELQMAQPKCHNFWFLKHIADLHHYNWQWFAIYEINLKHFLGNEVQTTTPQFFLLCNCLTVVFFNWQDPWQQNSIVLYDSYKKANHWKVDNPPLIKFSRSIIISIYKDPNRRDR